MKRLLRPAICLWFVVLMLPSPGGAQTFEPIGTRAAGMGGAFVGVADDASAIYWNPAGLAGGAYFSLVLDRNRSKSTPDDDPRAASSSGTLIALSTPAFGVGYYRLRSVSLTPVPTIQLGQAPGFAPDGVLRVDSLITHHAGATLVQSLTRNIAVGATLKVVRGVAAETFAASTADRDELLDEGTTVIAKATTKFDADAGIIGLFGAIRAGLTVRNLTQPEFPAAGGSPVRRLDRQVRAGVSARPLGVLLAADVDLTRNAGAFGEVREVAAGAEARVLPRAFVRAGFRVNLLEEALHGHSRVLAFGGSFAAMGALLVDAQVSTGAGPESRSWGVAGRVMF